MKPLNLLFIFFVIIIFLIIFIIIFKENDEKYENDEKNEKNEKNEKKIYTLSSIENSLNKISNNNPYIIDNYKEKMNNLRQLIKQISNTDIIPHACYNLPNTIDLSNRTDNLNLNSELYILSEFALYNLYNNKNNDNINYKNITLLYLFLMKNFTGSNIKYIQFYEGNPNYVSFDTDFNTGIIPFTPSIFVKEFIKNQMLILEKRTDDYNSRPNQSKIIIDYLLENKDIILKDIEECSLNNNIVFSVDILNKLLGIQYLIKFISTPYINNPNNCEL
jgi:hypothetical protein